MDIQAGTLSVATGLARPDSTRVAGRPAFPLRGGQSSAPPPADGVPARSAGSPEVQQAVAANFAEEARPTRNLPRGSLVDLVV